MKTVEQNQTDLESNSQTATQASYGAFAKAGLVFGSSVGAFALAKTSGALSWLGNLGSSAAGSASTDMKAFDSEVLTETSLAALMPNTPTQTSVVATDLMLAERFKALQTTNPAIFEELALPKGLSKALRTEFQVNTFIDDNQDNPSVAALPNGGFVVTWASSGQDPDGSQGVYGQRYDANGPAGSEFRVNTSVSGAQNSPSIAALANGGFVVAWASNGGISAQRYDTTGAAVGGEFRVNTFADNGQSQPSLAALDNGSFVVTWQGQGASDVSGIFAQRYDATGIKVGSEFRVNTFTDSEQDTSSVTALTNGGFVVTWRSQGQDGSGTSVQGQRYDSAGATVGGEFRVNTFTSDSQQLPSVAALSNGGFVVTWTSDSQDGSSTSVQAQLYDATGATVLNEFRVNTFTSSFQSRSSVAALSNGGFVVTWTSNGQDGSGTSVQAQLYNATGAKVGNELRVNTFTANDQDFSSVAALTNGGFVVTWTSAGQDAGTSSGIFAQLFTPPVLLSNTLSINRDQTVVLSSNDLSAMDNETASEGLTFTVSNLQNGRFAFGSSPGITITHFTQAQLRSGQVVFVHTGGGSLPSYSVSVSDGMFATDPVAATIHFDGSPSSTVSVSGSPSSSISATTTRSSTVSVSPSPSSSVSATTTRSSTVSPTPSNSVFINVDPILVHNQLRIALGQTVTLSPNDLSATGGLDNNPATLVFRVSDVQGGRFELIANPGIAIETFTQQQVNNRQIQFVHFGENAPVYAISVSNGVITTPAAFATVDFNAASPTPAPTQRDSASPVSMGTIIGSTVGAIGVLGSIVGLYFLNKRRKALSAAVLSPKKAETLAQPDWTDRDSKMSIPASVTIELPQAAKNRPSLSVDMTQSAADVRLRLLQEHGISPRTDAFQNCLKGLQGLLQKNNISKKTVFISYAWEDRGTPELEELHNFLRRLADDLRTIGMKVFLDIQNNTGNMPNWMEQSIRSSNYFLVVGSPRYRTRAADPKTAVALEYGLISKINAGNSWAARTRSKSGKMLVPLLYSGTFDTSFPPDVLTSLVRDVKDFKVSNSYQLNLIGLERPLGLIPHCYPCFAMGGKLHQEYKALFSAFEERLKFLAEREQHLNLIVHAQSSVTRTGMGQAVWTEPDLEGDLIATTVQAHIRPGL